MKMTSTTRELLVLAMAWGLAACGGLAAADTGASESAGATGPSGSIEAVCSNRGAECDWSITKCKSDPACARWYACVSSCDASQPQACFESCKNRTIEPANGQSILTCLQQACAGAQAVGGDAAPGYNGGYGGSAPKGEGGSGLEDGTGGAESSLIPVWETCRSCLYDGQSTDSDGGIVMNCQSQCLDGCHKALTECQSACASNTSGCDCETKLYECKTGCSTAGYYKHVIGNNVPNEVTGEPDGCLLQTSWEGFEKCMFDSPTWVGADQWAGYINSGLHQCVMTQCANVCLPAKTYQTCASCLTDKCTDQTNAYWSSFAAQNYGWCMDYCDPAVHESCDCEGFYGEGAEILTQFVMCREKACYDQCSN